MKRFIFFFLSSFFFFSFSADAQVVTLNAQVVAPTEGMELSQSGTTQMAVVSPDGVEADPAFSIGAEKDSPEDDYVARRLAELEEELYEKTRQEVLKEESQKKPKYDDSDEDFYIEEDEELSSPEDEFELLDEEGVEREIRRRIRRYANVRRFGFDFFKKGRLARTSLFSSLAPSAYKLGPGDELKVIIWSDLGDETIYDLKVNPEGQVYVPILGVFTVADLTVGEFESRVLGQLGEKFKHFRGQVTLNRVRTIQIFAVGEVVRPGAMTVSGLATAFYALYTAGGPNERGSMRNIQIMRNTGEVYKIDLYKYLLLGDRSQDLYLNNGDTIFVPVVGNQIRVDGMVNRPAIYEFDGKKSISDVIEMAGGIRAEAYSGRLSLVRWVKDGVRESFDFALDDNSKLAAFMIKDRDELMIERAGAALGNVVRIVGAVSRPGSYSFDSDLRVMDLIERAGGLLTKNLRIDKAHVFRRIEGGQQEIISFDLSQAMQGHYSDNILLHPDDTIRIYTDTSVKANNRYVIITGAVRRQGRYLYRDGMRLSDILFAARGLALESSGEVEVARVDGNKSRVFTVDANAALADPKNPDNILVQPLDSLSVKVRGDALLTSQVVNIKGNVKKPGPYAIQYPGEKLSSLIERAGGLVGDAFPEGAVFMRKMDNVFTNRQFDIARDIQNEMFRDATLDLRADLLRAGAKDLNAKAVVMEASEPLTANLQGSIARVKDPNAVRESDFGAIEIAPRNLSNRAIRIPINLKAILDDKADEYEDIALMDGDILTVPSVSNTVVVLGAVVNPTPILFCNNKSVRYYIDRAGGFSRHSNHSRTVVVKANGEVKPMKSVRRIERGDIVLVPPAPRLVRPDSLKEISSIAAILGNLAVLYKVADK